MSKQQKVQKSQKGYPKNDQCKTYLIYGPNKNGKPQVDGLQVCKNVPACHEFIQATAFFQNIFGYPSYVDDEFTKYLSERKIEKWTEQDSVEFCKRQHLSEPLLDNSMIMDWCLGYTKPENSTRPNGIDIQQNLGDERRLKRKQCMVKMGIKKTIFDEQFFDK